MTQHFSAHFRAGVTMSAITLAFCAIPSPASAAPPMPDVSSISPVVLQHVKAEMKISKRVVVPADAVWEIDVPQITVVPAPVPEPEPVPLAPEPAPVAEQPAERAQEPASRGAERTAIPAPEAVAEPVTSAPAAAANSSIIGIAAQYVGVPYVSGGTTPDGFDCSGFTSYVYAQAGISLPRTSGDQRNAGTVVSRADAQPGDLIWSPGHIAIYAGDGQMIDSPRPGKSVQFRPMWQSDPVFIRVG